MLSKGLKVEFMKVVYQQIKISYYERGLRGRLNKNNLFLNNKSIMLLIFINIFWIYGLMISLKKCHVLFIEHDFIFMWKIIL